MTSPQLTVQCHKSTKAPFGMIRGSATTDDQFTYLTPYCSDLVYRYEWSSSEKWEQLPPTPYKNSALVIIDGTLTAVGGRNGSHTTNKLFTLQQDRWVEKYPPMNTARSNTAVVCTSDGNHILVIGGDVECFNWTVKVEFFHVRNKRWYELTDLPQALHRPSATICGNQIHVIGGDGDGYSGSLHDLVSCHQPIALISNIVTWTPLPQQPVLWSTAATLRGQLVIVGGVQDWMPVKSLYQLVHGSWVEIGSMYNGKKMCSVISLTQDMMIVGADEKDTFEELVVV